MVGMELRMTSALPSLSPAQRPAGCARLSRGAIRQHRQRGIRLQLARSVVTASAEPATSPVSPSFIDLLSRITNSGLSRFADIKFTIVLARWVRIAKPSQQNSGVQLMV